MEITNKAKTALEDLFAKNDADCLKANLQKSCCGTSLVFSLTKLKDTDKPILINGIPLLLEDGVKQRAQTVTISVENGNLNIKDTAPASSC